MTRRFVLLFLAALACCQSACGICFPASKSKPHAANTISITEVANLLQQSDAIFVYDANSQESYRQGHVPTAKWVQYDEVKKEQLPGNKDAMLVFYCYNELCSASSEAAKQAVSLGYTNVRVMEAGIEGWQKAKQRTES